MFEKIKAKLRRKNRRGFTFYAENATIYRLKGNTEMAKMMENMAKEELKKERR